MAAASRPMSRLVSRGCELRPNKRLYPATKNGARPNDRGEIEIVRSGGGKLTPPSAG